MVQAVVASAGKPGSGTAPSPTFIIQHPRAKTRWDKVKFFQRVEKLDTLHKGQQPRTAIA